MVTLAEIRELAARIASAFDPDRVILFGSHARGDAGPDSDVDLLVILPFEGKPFWKSVEIAVEVAPSFPADVLARRPDDTARRYEQGDPLIREALDSGRTLYERGG